jgi:DNA-binding transcriptional regulator YiaG
MANPVGRPTKYNDKILKDAEKYLLECVDTTEQVVTGESEKFTSYKEKIKVNLPTIEGLAVYLNLSKDTLYHWEKEHKEFSYVIEQLRGNQIKSLVNNGLSGDYNPTIAKVLLSKHGYSEKHDIEHSGKIETITGMTVK